MPMSDEETRELLRWAQAGDELARERVVNENLNLVRSIIQRFTNRGYEWDDLFQIGCIGLLKAVDRFNLKYDVKFSTYAVPMIIGEIKRFLRDDNPVKVSRPVKELAYKIHRAQEQLQGTLGREPTVGELAEMLKTTPAEIVAALEAVLSPTSLNELVYQDGGDPIYVIDQIGADSLDGGYFERLALEEVLLKLPEKERKILHLRFFQDKTQTEVAQIIGLSQVQVSRLERQALKSIRRYLATS